MSRPCSFRTMIDGREAELRIHEPNYAGNVEGAKLFKVIVFGPDDSILAVRNRKTIDLPGGRIEWEDDTLADAARREVEETAGVTLGSLARAAVMVAAPLGNAQRLFSTIMVVTGRATVAGLQTATLRMHRYAFLRPVELLKRYNAGPPELLQRLIEMAEFALPEEADGNATRTRKYRITR